MLWQLHLLVPCIPAPPPASDDAGIHRYFHEHGFVFVPSLLTPDEVNHLCLGVEALVRNETEKSGYHPSTSERALLLTNFVTDEDYARVDHRQDLAFHFDEPPLAGDPPVLRSINNLIFSPLGAQLARDARILKVIAAALGEDALGVSGAAAGPLVRFFNSRVFAKPPGGAGTAWHRDIRFFNMVDRTDGAGGRSGARTAINALLLLDEQTVANGALRVVPGSHRNTSRRGALDLVEEFGQAYADAQQRAEAGSADAPVLPGELSLVGLPVGTLVLVDHYTLHGSGPNTETDATAPHGRRRMVSLGFAGPHIATWTPGEAEAQLQRNIAVLGLREAGEVADYYNPPEWVAMHEEGENSAAPATVTEQSRDEL